MKRQKNEKLQKFISSTIIIIVAVIAFFIGFFAIGKTPFFDTVINFATEKTSIKTDNIFLNLLFTILTVSMLYFLYKKVLPKINKKILFVLMIIFTLTIGFAWINYLKLKPISDQSMVVSCAEKILDNDLKPILAPGNYLSRNPHQLGFVLLISLIFKLFNTRNVIFIQSLSVIAACISTITMYFIVKELFEEEIIHKISTLFIAFFSIYFAFFSPHVYGNLSGLAFALIAVLFTLKFINTNKSCYLAIIAISITIAYILKSNYEIFLIAIIIELSLKALKDFNLKPIIGIVCILTAVFGIKSIIYTCFEKWSNYSLNNGVPVISYIYMGIAEPQTLTPGWYTGDVEYIYNISDYNKEKAKEKTNELLEKRTKYLTENPKEIFYFFKSKLETTWLNPTFQTIWCSTPGIILDIDPAYNNYVAPKKLLISIVTGRAYDLEERIMDIYQILVFLSASFSLFTLIKEGNLNKMFLPIIFLGGFTFHLIWETKAIYVLQYFYLLIPYAVFGLYKLFNLIDKKIKTIKEKA